MDVSAAKAQKLPLLRPADHLIFTKCLEAIGGGVKPLSCIKSCSCQICKKTMLTGVIGGVTPPPIQIGEFMTLFHGGIWGKALISQKLRHRAGVLHEMCPQKGTNVNITVRFRLLSGESRQSSQGHRNKAPPFSGQIGRRAKISPYDYRAPPKTPAPHLDGKNSAMHCSSSVK